MRFVIFPFRFVMREILFKVYATSLATLFFQVISLCTGAVVTETQIVGKEEGNNACSFIKRRWKVLKKLEQPG